MQPAATALATVLENATASDPRDLTWLFEFYPYSVTPGVDGFDPADAVQRFASIEITWLGFAYRRAVLDAGSITKAKGSQANRCTLRLSNADENRYVATWVTLTEVEGMRLVVRLISRSASTTLAASNQRFSGRCDRPEGFDVIQGSISATEDVGGDDVEFPPRLYLADDPEGRSPADPLFEGFPLVVLAGSFTFQRPEADKRFSRKDPRRYFETLPWSSYDETPLGDPLMMVLGRSQIRVYRGVFMDTGRLTTCLDFVCMGPIADILNFRMDNTPEYQSFFSPLENITYHLGEAGGTGTQTADPLWPNHPLFSFTAYVGYSFRYIGTGAFSQIDAGHDTLMTVLGLTMSLPDSSGDFTLTDWSDNGAYQTRLLLTGSRFFNIDPAFIEDPACLITGQYNDEPLVDESNSGQILIPDPDFDSAGVDFQRFRSTALINARRARFDLGLTGERYEATPVDDFDPFDPFDPPLVAVDVLRLCKRFTSNVLLKKRVKAKDFLYKTLLPSYRGYLVWNYRGRIEPRSERPADFAHLRAATAIGATTLLIEDATTWKASGGLWGRIYLGKGGDSGDTNSEIRKVTAAAYTSDANTITLTASKVGAVTVSASGVTLSGGNSTTRATGTITVGGSPAAGNTVTVTINGHSIVYTVESSETTATVAYMVAAHINAHTQLRRIVSATASGSVVTVSSKWGVLTLSSALANTHGGPVANPTSAPSLTASGSGSSLSAGTYHVAYANRNAVGSTYVSPYSSITITAGQQINTPTIALPAGVTSRDWFLSKAANDAEMVLHTNTTSGTGFALTAPPSSTAAFPPEYNTTGEEVVRIALPFASNNQTAGILAQANLTRGNIFDRTYKWPGQRENIRYTEVVGSYVSAKDDFAASKVIVSDPELKARLGKTSPRELDLTAVDGYHQARRLVFYDFAKYVDRNWFNALRSNGLALLIEEGDLICASDDSGGHVNVLTQVEDYTIQLADFTVSINKARLYSTQMFRELVPKTRPLLPSVLKWVATLDTEIQLLDLPFWRERDAGQGAGLYVAVRRASGAGSWDGTWVWIDAGEGYVQRLSLDVEAVTGGSLTTLADHAPGLDTLSTVRVRLDNASDVLASVTEAELGSGANLFRLGGEIFQARDAALVSGTDADYDLSYLKRGLYGTENETSTHTSSDGFTVLDGRVFYLPLDAALVGKELKVKAVTVNQDLADAAEHTITWQGYSLKPLAIARVETDPDTGLAPRDSGGSILVQAWPRTNADVVGDEYLLECLEDDGTLLSPPFSVPFKEGGAAAALLISYSADSGSKYVDVDRNTLAVSGMSKSVRSVSLQIIRAAENFVEAVLSATGTGSAWLGVTAVGVDWRTTTPQYVINVSPTGGHINILTPEMSLTTFGSYTSGDEVRVRIEVAGREVKFYAGATAPGAAPLYVSPTPPNYPLRAHALAQTLPGGGTASAAQVMLTTDPFPSTVVTAEQQTLLYGAPKESMRVRIRQHSGIRQIGYGIPFEEDI